MGSKARGLPFCAEMAVLGPFCSLSYTIMLLILVKAQAQPHDVINLDISAGGNIFSVTEVGPCHNEPLLAGVHALAHLQLDTRDGFPGGEKTC